MTAEVVILPVLRIERHADGVDIRVRLNTRHHRCVTRLATEWKVSVEEAAAMLLLEGMAARGRGKT